MLFCNEFEKKAFLCYTWLAEKGRRGMKDFSVRQMRREYRGVFRLLLSVFTVLMLCCATLGAILAAKGTDEKILLIASGIMPLWRYRSWACI